MNNLELWKKIEGYLSLGINIIPVRSTADSLHLARTPYRGWKKYQELKITPAEVYKQIEEHQTQSVAFVCGPISGNLEIINIDTKTWVGIDVALFDQIKKTLPGLFDKMRIHRTPSGGYHILYRIDNHEPDESLDISYKSESKDAAIKLIGAGGYCLIDGCLDYSVHQDNPIPTISWTDRKSLMAICESFDEKRRTELIKPHKNQTETYDINPFEDYNNKEKGEILTEYGWKIFAENDEFIWYSYADKSSNISASFNKLRRVYYIFTPSTGFDPSIAYSPSVVLSKLQFNGDTKGTFTYFVSTGFGKVNKEKELKYARQYAISGEPIPNNFSEEAKNFYNETIEKRKEAYPFGEFIKYDRVEEKMEVSREAVYYVSEKLGFCIHQDKILLIEEHIVKTVPERYYYDTLKSYIKDDDDEVLEDLLNIWEKFIQKNGKFTIERLPEFDTDLLLKDDKNNSYQYFSNCWIHITAQDIKVMKYEDFKNLVFEEKIRDREFEITDNGGVYLDYLIKAVAYNDYVASIIGFLCHDYKDETTGFIPVLTEVCEDPADGGGSGKNVFCSLFKHVTSFVNKNCSGVKQDEKFFQMWTGQRILALSDLPDNFDFSPLKEASTGSILHKRLFHDEKEIPVEETPKFVCQTNYSVDIKDGGLKRRVKFLEFSDFFTKEGGIDAHYGKHFPNDWTKEDWLGFDNIIARSIQRWISNGLKIKDNPITATGWSKKFKHTYGPTIYGIIETNWKEWCSMSKVNNEHFKKCINDYYSENNISKKYEVTMHRLNKALKEYGDRFDINFVKDAMWSEMGINVRGKRFLTGFEVEEETEKVPNEDSF